MRCAMPDVTEIKGRSLCFAAFEHSKGQFALCEKINGKVKTMTLLDRDAVKRLCRSGLDLLIEVPEREYREKYL